MLNNLPQVVAENSSGQSISSNGTATVSLRGLGSQRTLVLINGRRMNPGGAGGTPAATPTPDINQIPAAMIQRVDVLTGGASAVYGADAVAGVVNFVMDTHYQGVQAGCGLRLQQHKNNNQQYLGLLAAAGDRYRRAPPTPGEQSVSFLAGSNFADGKGNATAVFHLLQQLAGGRIPVRLCGLHAQYAEQAARTRRSEVRRLELERHRPLLGIRQGRRRQLRDPRPM